MSLSEKEEFVRLLSENKDSLYRFCANIILDKNAAEDVLQEAIISAYRVFDNFRPGSDFRAWLFRFVINKVLNHNRKFKRDLLRTHTQDVDLVETLEKESAYGYVLERPEDFFEKVDDRIKEALLSLNPTGRMVFLLRSVEGFSYKEIATFLDIPIGTVMSHLSRSRAKLRECLAGYARQMGFVR